MRCRTCRCCGRPSDGICPLCGHDHCEPLKATEWARQAAVSAAASAAAELERRLAEGEPDAEHRAVHAHTPLWDPAPPDPAWFAPDPLDAVAAAKTELDRRRAAVKDAEQAYYAAIRAARAAGLSGNQIGRVAGVTRKRVYQIEKEK